MTAAVAALFIKSDNVIVSTSKIANATIVLPADAYCSNHWASSSAAPVLNIASATGSNAASSTITGQSMT